MPKIRILIVDDAVVVRRMVAKALSEDPEIEVVGTAANGRIALAKIPQVNPDVILLDVEMPEMNGLQTLAVIRKTYPHLPVIMFSSLTELGATATIEALALGATDYVTKPVRMSKDAANKYIQDRLLPKIKVFCQPEQIHTMQQLKRSPPPPARSGQTQFRTIARGQVDVVAIGVSTGGPNALAELLPALPANFPVPVAIVQHMPPVFTTRLAARLNQLCQLEVAEGFAGAILEPGKVWIAPGNYHMVVERHGTEVRLNVNQDPPENYCRPAVDVLFRSVAKIYGSGTLGTILTGMGQDGLRGCEKIREAGGRAIVQDQASSVVWGMPAMVAQAGLANAVLPLDQIAGEIIRCVMPR